MTKSKIATAPRPRKPADILDAPTAAEWLADVDPTLATLFNQVEERLRAAQDEERDAHEPVDWDTVQQELAEERARLLVAAGDAIDVIMGIGELKVHVAREVAGREAAQMMASAGLRMPRQPRALLPPDDPDQQERERLYMAGLPDDDDTDDTDLNGLPLLWPADDDTDDTDRLHAIHEHARNTTDPDAETVEIVKAVTARPRASDGHGLRWWARISMVATTVSAALTGLALIGASLTQWAIS